jgi:hypothetical protein
MWIINIKFLFISKQAPLPPLPPKKSKSNQKKAGRAENPLVKIHDPLPRTVYKKKKKR